MRSIAWAFLIAALVTVVPGTSPARADTVAYRSAVSTFCRTELWDACATTFRHEQVRELSRPVVAQPAACLEAVGPQHAGCFAGLQREVHATALVGAGDTGGVNIVYTIPPGHGPGTAVASSGTGGRMLLRACNNDPATCPGELSLEVVVEVPDGAEFRGITRHCLALVPTGVPVALCAHPQGEVPAAG